MCRGQLNIFYPEKCVLSTLIYNSIKIRIFQPYPVSRWLRSFYVHDSWWKVPSSSLALLALFFSVEKDKPYLRKAHCVSKQNVNDSIDERSKGVEPNAR